MISRRQLLTTITKLHSLFIHFDAIILSAGATLEVVSSATGSTLVTGAMQQTGGFKCVRMPLELSGISNFDEVV